MLCFYIRDFKYTNSRRDTLQLTIPVMLWKHALWRRPENISSPIIAKIIITKRTRRAMWNKGIIAINIAFNTIWRPVREILKCNYPLRYIELYSLSVEKVVVMTLKHLLGIPDKNLSGLRTRNALNALASSPSTLSVDSNMSKNLK